MCAKFYLNRMVRFQNRRNRTRWTSDVFWIMRSAIGTLPGLARTTVGHNTAPDHPVEARLLQLHCREARKMCIERKEFSTIKFSFSVLLTKVVFVVFNVFHIWHLHDTWCLTILLVTYSPSMCKPARRSWWITAMFYFNNVQRKVEEFQH